MTVRQRVRRLEDRVAANAAQAAQERRKFGQARALLAQRLGVELPADREGAEGDRPAAPRLGEQGARERLINLLDHLREPAGAKGTL